MKASNYQKPDKAKGVIVSAIAVVFLISVTIFLFRLEDEKTVITKKKENHQELKKQVGDNYSVLTDSSEEIPIRKHLLMESTPAIQGSLAADKPFAGISPPLPSRDISFTGRQVNANVGESITTSRNSQIIIPPRAFLDENGNVVEGNVDIQYREFHNFHDIFLSGVPMNFDSEGKEQMLESAGMIELTASKDGSALYVNPENKIRVMLASAAQSTDYNIYFYDKKEKKWKEKGKDAVVLQRLGDIRSDRDAITVQPRPLSFVYNGSKYQVGMQCASDMQDSRKFFLSKKKTPTNFDFMLISCKEIQPELKTLRGIIWRYEGADAREVYSQIFSTSDVKSSAFRTVSFNGRASFKLNEDSTYQMELVQSKFVMNITIRPVTESIFQQTGFRRRWPKYLAAIEKRNRDEEAAFEQFQKDTAEYYRRFVRIDKNVISAQAVALRTFTIDGFGIWNCDRPYKPETPNNVFARFVDEKGNPLVFNTAYMVEKARNSVYTLTDFQQFRFNPNAKILCWAVLPGDKIAIIYPEEFARHSQSISGPCTFRAKINDTAFQSYAALRSALNFN